MKKKNFLFSIICCIALLGSFVISTPTIANASLPEREDCLPAVLLLRGSGEQTIKEGRKYFSSENPNTPYLQTDGAEGDILNNLLQGFVNVADPEKSVSKVRFVDIDYPALNVPFLGDNQTLTESLKGILGDYQLSYRIGASNIVKFINSDEQRGCETQYMLVGYSQGVLSVRLSLNLLGDSSNKIASTYVIGDPAQFPFQVLGPQQVTPANTSPSSSSVMFTLLSAATALPSGGSALYAASLVEVGISNSILYRNNANIPSRVLCHAQDPTCNFVSMMNIEHHLSYFDENTNEGQNDISNEIPEFNKQVETLALSAAPQNAQRVLTSSHTFGSDSVIYNIVGSKKYSSCSWDLNYDGVYEYQNDCQSYTVPAIASSDNSDLQKMMVKLTDWTGQENFYIKEQSVFKPNLEEVLEDLNNATKLDPNSWYQIHPYSDSQKCLEVDQLTNVSDVSSEPYIQENDCELTNPTSTNEILEASTQAFKPVEVTSQSTETQTHFKWGYDDNYTLQLSSDGELYEVNNDSSMGLKMEFVTLENGVPYYRLRTLNKCASIQSGYLQLSPTCEPESLFSFTNVTNPYFGALSYERDMQAPSDVTNIQWTNITNTSATLTWNHAIDSRNGLENTDVKYRIYTEDSIPTDYSWFTTSDNFYEMDYNTWDLYRGKNIIIEAVDGKINNAGYQNISSGVSTYFRAPNIPQQPKPQLRSVEFSQNYSAIKINLPYDNENPDLIAKHINIYRNGNLYDVAYGTQYTDTNVEIGQTYTYAYQLVHSTGQVSDISEPLTVYTVDNIAPSQPGNFFGPMWKKYGEPIELTWNHSTDNVTSTANMRYDVYRNDIKITDVPIATNTYSDLQAPSGSNKYYVKAIDEAGNSSRSMNTVYVSVSQPVTPPPPVTPGGVKPVVTIDTVNLQNISLSIASPDTGIASYNIYRNGEFYENSYYSIYWDWSVTPGTEYSYQVETVLNDGTVSPKSDIATAQIPYAPEMEVTNMHTIYNSYNASYIAWDTNEPSYVQLYNIYRDGEYLGTTSDTYFIDKTVVADTTYVYTVELQDIWGRLAFSSPYTLITNIEPSGIDEVAPSTFEVKWNETYYTSEELYLKWSESIDNASSVTYKIYRNNELVATTNDTEYLDDTLEVGNAYAYMVQAIDDSGNTTGINTVFRLWT